MSRFLLSYNFIYDYHSSGDANVEDDCPGSYYENR